MLQRAKDYCSASKAALLLALRLAVHPKWRKTLAF
jgi:hypothetical protein